jgi:enamine deaminase RidA (YjgF/YER057c/UK114 family)
MAARQSIDLAGMSHGVPIPNGCKIGNIVFSSAFSGRDASSGNIPEDPDAQAEVLFNNIRAFMEAAGGTPENIGHVTVYLKENGYRESINKEWLKMFPDEHSRPARHAIEAPIRGNGLYFQVELIAVL